jgi:hypothetical protein
MVIYEDAGRDVHGRSEHEPLANPRRSSAFLDFIGYVDDLLPFASFEGQIRGMGEHREGFELSAVRSVERLTAP